jgi:hypothetical protein
MSFTNWEILQVKAYFSGWAALMKMGKEQT